MSGLSEYIEKIKKYLDENPDTTEEMLIRYVYLDLGSRFSFDPNFLPFGNSKKRRQIYRKSDTIEGLNDCMESNTVTCISASKCFNYILSHFGVKIKEKVDGGTFKECPHVYSIVYPKDGSEPYSVDLQEDMYHIQMHGFTTNFGHSLIDSKLVIPRLKQVQMDKKLGYIDAEHHYTDEYLYLLKSDMDYFTKFEEKVKFVLENIEVFENPQMQYTDRQWYHVRILQNLFSTAEFDYFKDGGKIKILNCYKEVEGIKKYINCISVQTQNGMDIYVYNKKESKYSQIDFMNFAKAVKNGVVLHECKVKGLGKALKQLKNEKGREH